MDDHELNALENSLISVEFYDEELDEWIEEDEAEEQWDGVEDMSESEEEESFSDDEESFSDDEESLGDEEWVPPARLRSTCRRLNIDSRELPIITPEEQVYAHDLSVAEGDEHDYAFETPQLEFKIKDKKDIVGMPSSIVYTDCLLALTQYLKFPYSTCKEKGCKSLVIQEPTVKPVGSGIILRWKCEKDHLQGKWCSQPRFKYGLQGGDFMLASSILLSGNNYRKVNLLCKFMKLGCVSSSTFYSIQSQYCVPTIKEYWREGNTRRLEALRTKDNVVLLGDGRMDSPGHCAQYCTYTTMDNDSKEIVSVVVVDKRETGRKSGNTEKAGFQKMMAGMEAAGVQVKEICTDAHPQISALMRTDTGVYGKKGIFHSLDIWHAAKNLLKKIVAAGQEKGCSDLKKWAGHIVNHFWHCCKKSETDLHAFLGMWSSVLNHVCNKHTWALGKCHHGPILDEENRTTKWLVPGSLPHEKLREIITNRRWLKSAYKFLRFRQTYLLESFQNHILMYASKRFAFIPDVYTARCLLAAIDYNYHKDRPVATRKSDGAVRTNRAFQKKSERWTYHNVKVAKDYGYIDEVQGRIVASRINSGKGMSRKQPRSADDPRRLGPLAAQPPPPTAELVQQHRSRVNDNVAVD
ncbi:uncharacterized protein LOC144884851 [Branchiostoma floridae x Branchiostoma japonicum]